MFIKLLNIDHFGTWEDSKFEEFTNSTTVIYGPNESGKTTLMEFVRGIFFGWSTSDRMKYLDSRRKGPQGGEITLVDQAGEEWLISRHSEYGNDEQWHEYAKITKNGHHIDADIAWEQLLWHVNDAIFENVFTIGLRELEELAALDQTDAAEFLYDLSAGIERLSLSNAAVQVCDESDLIVNDSQTNDSIRYCMSEQDAAYAVRQSGNTAIDQWCRTANRIKGIRSSIEQAQVRSKQNDDQLRLVETAKTSAHWLAEREELQVELSSVGGFMPAGCDNINEVIASLKLLEDQIADAKDQLSAQATTIQRLTNERQAIDIDESLIKASPRIVALEEQAPWLATLLGQINSSEQELLSLKKELSTTGSEHNEDWIAGGRSVLVALRKPARQLKDAKTELVRANEQLAESQKKQHDLQDELSNKQEELNVDALEVAIRENGRLISRIRQRLDVGRRIDELTSKRETIERDHIEWSDRQILSMPVLAGLGIAFISGVTALLTLVFLGSYLDLTGSARIIYLSVGITGLLGSVFLKTALQTWARQKLKNCENSLSLAATQKEQLISLREQLDSDLSMNSQEYVLRLEEALDRDQELRTLIPIRDAVDVACRDTERCQAHATTTTERLEEVQTIWQRALSELDIPIDLSPSQVKRCIEQSDVISIKQTRRAWLESEISNRKTDLNQLTDRIKHLQGELGLKEDSDDPLQVIRDLSALIATAERNEHHCQQLQLEIEKESHLRTVTQSHLDELDRELNRSFISYGVASLAELERVGSLWETNANKQTRLEQLNSQFASLDVDYVKLQQLLTEHSEESVEELAASLAVLKSDLDRELMALNQQLGALEQQKCAIEAERKYDTAALEHEYQTTLIGSHVEDWRILATTEQLFQQLRQEYETTRQPEVLQNASQFLKEFTEGRYTRVWTPVEEPTLYLDDENGEIWTLDVLSRGTREAVFLCIRFALVKHFATRGLKLPLILDDVLVNCDATRTTAALRVIESLRESVSQVFYFTCHEYMREAFVGNDADVRTITPRTDLIAPALNRHWGGGHSEHRTASVENVPLEVELIEADPDSDTVLADETEIQNRAA